MGGARELLGQSRALQESGQPQEALAFAKRALDDFRAAGEEAGIAEALRHVLGGQIALLEVTPQQAQQVVKDEKAKIRRSDPSSALSDGLLDLAASEVSLFQAEAEQAMKAATAAAHALAKGGGPDLEAEALLVLVNAQLMYGNKSKATRSATAAVAAAQKAKNIKTEGLAWLSVATTRHVSGGEDAKEGTRRALELFRKVNDHANEAAALTLEAKLELSSGDAQVALLSAQDALALARNEKNGPQTAAALEVVVEARIAVGQKQEALDEAMDVLSEVEERASSNHGRGVAEATGALVLAHTACKGVAGAITIVKTGIEKLRQRGDRRGEVQLLHKLATLSPVAPEAMNSAQAAWALVREIGHATEAAAVERTLSSLWVAKGKAAKAPSRKSAMKALGGLARALEREDAETFDDLAQHLDGYYNVLKQEDVELALGRIIAKDADKYQQFLRDHGSMFADEKPAEIKGHTAKPFCPHLFYFNFRATGLGYGPRFRVNVPAYAKYNSETASISIVEISEEAEQWERELGFSASLLDGVLQSGAVTGFIEAAEAYQRKQ